MATAPPPARQRFNPRGRAAALPSSYTTSRDTTPGKMGGHVPRKIRGAHEAWLMARIVEAPFTLRGLVAELAGRGLKVDYRTVWSFVHRARLSFKKNGRGQRAGPA